MPKESLPPSPLEADAQRVDTAGVDTAVPPAASASASASGKRTSGVLSWDDTFIFMTALAARRSKDPSTQVGACIVDEDNRIVSIGYNGFPRNCSDDSLPWGRVAADPLDTKYPYVVHAEANALLNTRASVRGARLYVGLFPCNDCAKLIIQSGIVEVVYASDKYRDAMPFIAARRLFSLAGVKTRFHAPAETSITLHVVNDDARASAGGASDAAQLTTAPVASPAAAATEGRRFPSPVASTPLAAAPEFSSPAVAAALSPTSAARARAISEAEGKD